MARDIEEFLRKAAERRNQQQQQQQQQPVQNQPVRRPMPPTPNRESVPLVQDVEVVQPRESVERHVQRHVNTAQIVEQTKHLAEEVSLADEKMEGHLKEVFEHQVGNLTKSGANNPPSGNTAPVVRRKNSDLIAMIRNPNQFRNALIIAEILKRPEY